MEFGSKEWFEVVEENSTFPSDFAFFVGVDRKLKSVCLDRNVKDVNNYKVKEVGSWSDVALIKVRNCRTSQEYYEVTKNLKELWS